MYAWRSSWYMDIYIYIYIQTNANAQVGLRCNDCLGCRVVVLGLEI